MDAKPFHFLPTKPPLRATISSPKSSASAPPTRLPIFTPIRRHKPINLCAIRRTGTNANANANGTDIEPESVESAEQQITPPPETVEVRFRRRPSKRSSRQQSDGNGGGTAKAAAPAEKKKWEDMSVGEKAVELYVGEKGALYWLNKFAYASIFIVIGGWIVFRFVGPALNLYQLDSAPLAPDAILRGSS